MAITETSIDLQVVDAKDSTLTLEELLSLSSNNSCAIFLTPHGVIMGGKVIANVANLEGFIPTSKASVNPTANSIVKRDGNGDIKVHGIVDDTGNMYALPYSSDEVKDNADAILQIEITDLDTIRDNAKTAADAIPDLEGDIEQLFGSKQNVIADLDEIREGASAGSISLPATLEYSEYTFTEKVTPEVKNESATIRSIKGNSVVWNNSVNNADSTSFRSGNANGVISANGDVYTLTSVSGGSMYLFYRTTAFINSLIVGHSYILLADIKHNSASNMWLSVVGVSDDSSIKISQNNTWDSYGKVFAISNISSSTPFIRVLSGTTVSGEEVSIRKLRLVDLTKMFGANNEPTTVEEFYEQLPKGVDINAYNEGEIVNGNYNGIKSISLSGEESVYDLSWIKYYFPEGMRSDGTVRDEIHYNTTTNKWEAVQRVGSDNIALSTPIVTEVAPYDITYNAYQGGTEVLLTDTATTPITAEIAYNYDARSNIESLKQSVDAKADKANGTSAQFVKGDGSLDNNIYADVYTLTTRNGSLSTEQFNKLMTSKVVRMTANASENGNSNLEIQAVNKVYNDSSAVMSSMYYNGSQFKMAIITFTKSGTTWSYTTTLQNLGIAPAAVEV